jgi:hypothetical protein
MPFSLGNWIAVIVLDVLLRAASFIIPIYMLFAIPLSFIHLATLMSFSAYVRTFALAPRVAVDKTLVWTNVVFAVVFVTMWLGFIRNGRVTACAYDTCDWINGVVTWSGVGTIVVITLMQILINLFAVAIVLAFCKRKMDGAAA